MSIAALKTLLGVWLALLVLLGLSTASSYLDLGTGNSVVNLVIAMLKVSLIALFYMHLRHATATVRLAAGAALLFLFFLAFLSFADFLTRSNRPALWQAPSATSEIGDTY